MDIKFKAVAILDFDVESQFWKEPFLRLEVY